MVGGSNIKRTPYKCTEPDCKWGSDWPAAIAKHKGAHDRAKEQTSNLPAPTPLHAANASRSKQDRPTGCGYAKTAHVPKGLRWMWRCIKKNRAPTLRLREQILFELCPICTHPSAYAPSEEEEEEPQPLKVNVPTATLTTKPLNGNTESEFKGTIKTGTPTIKTRAACITCGYQGRGIYRRECQDCRAKPPEAPGELSSEPAVVEKRILACMAIGERITQRALVNRTGHPRRTLSTHMTNLQKRGYIESGPDLHDTRRTLYVLTGAGIAYKVQNASVAVVEAQYAQR